MFNEPANVGRVVQDGARRQLSREARHRGEWQPTPRIPARPSSSSRSTARKSSTRNSPITTRRPSRSSPRTSGSRPSTQLSHRAAADGAGRKERNHHRPVRQQGDDRRPAREGRSGSKTENYDRYFPRAVPDGAKQHRAYANELLTAFAQKAYRRPLSPTRRRHGGAARRPRRSHYREPGKTFEQGVAHAMAAVLSSPRFLFKLEAPAAHALNAQCRRRRRILAGLAPLLFPVVDDARRASCWTSRPAANCASNLARAGEAHAGRSARRKSGAQFHRPVAAGARRRRHRHAIRARSSSATPARKARCATCARPGAPRTKPPPSGWPHYIDKIVDSKPEFDNDMRKAMRRETEMYFGYVIARRPPGHRAHRQRLHLRQREAGDALRHARRHRRRRCARSRFRRAARAAACSRRAARCWSRPTRTAPRP